METIFFWLVAGATIALLGVFLIASERELKNKRLELEALRNQTSAVGIQDPTIGSSLYAQGSEMSTDLVARNEALAREVASLSRQLEDHESNLEQIKTLHAHLNSMETENSELLAERERLRSEISTINTPLTTDAKGNEENDSRISELKEQLEISQAKIRDLESTREQLADAESRQTAFEEIQKSHEATTLQLQSAMSSEQEKQKALEAVQMQLSSVEQSYQELKERNLQLQEENSQLLEGLSQNQQESERSVAFRKQLQALQSKHSEIVEQERLLQEEIVAMTRFWDTASEEATYSQPFEAVHDDQTVEVKSEELVAVNHNEHGVEQTILTQPEAGIPFSSDQENVKEVSPLLHYDSEKLTPAVASQVSDIRNYAEEAKAKNKRRFGIFPAAVAVVVIGGALTAGYLGENSDRKLETNQLPYQASLESGFEAKKSNAVDEDSGHKSVAPDSQRITEGNKVTLAAHETRGDLPIEPKLTKAPAKAGTSLTDSGNSLPLSWETYEITQPTRVFSAPRENSELVAKVDPGTRVSVVNNRNGWLEIRSKHGRPPGFIPRTAATRIGQQ